MITSLIYAIDLLLWILMAASVAYVAFFATMTLLPKADHPVKQSSRQRRFLVLYPAYNEDRVICRSVETFLQQDYPRERYQVAVISDHMQPSTNQWLKQQPILLYQPSFEKSSKAIALQYAISKTNGTFDNVVILDADNLVGKDFLCRVNQLCEQGFRAIQCHRTAKNSDNDIAALDGISEEINNTIFRRAHNRIGLSSALIGSGMCLDYEWFSQHVGLLSTAGEDRELEALLLRERIHVHYAENILVMDEKVSSGDNFQRQRLRWMTAQVQCLRAMLPWLPKAIATGNIDYVDKTLQQALIPRSVLLVLVTLAAIATTLLSALTAIGVSPLKWWILLLVLVLSLLAALPRKLLSLSLLHHLLSLPQLVWRMLANVVRIDPRSKDFIHTTHDK